MIGGEAASGSKAPGFPENPRAEAARPFGRILRVCGCKRWAVELMPWALPSGLGLGEHHVSGDKDRSEKSVGIAGLAYLFVLRVCQHEVVPGKPWSLFQLQHAWRLRGVTNQVEHTVKGNMGKTRKAA